jgi:hypothetical protein
MNRMGRIKPGCLLGIIVALLCLGWLGNKGQRRMRQPAPGPTPSGQTAPNQTTPAQPAPTPGPERQ